MLLLFVESLAIAMASVAGLEKPYGKPYDKVIVIMLLVISLSLYNQVPL